MSSLGGSYNYYGDFDVQSQGYLLIVSYWEYIVSMTMDISLPMPKVSMKRVWLCVGEEEFRLVSKMITLRYDPLWLNTAVTLKLTKRVDFLMAQQIRQRLLLISARAWCSVKFTTTSSSSNEYVINACVVTDRMLKARDSTAEERGKICPQEAYILIRWRIKDNEYTCKRSTAPSEY